MCGIAGILFSELSSGSPLEMLRRMAEVLHHRGPDESGIYLDDHIGLAHARLSIIDLAGGTQPIHNEDETLWIIYNGEVFNYPELREDLEQKGHRFYTTSDTEVLLHLFEERGADCLSDLNGQFAFAVWNTKKKELFLARDRVGIRPLHYTQHKGALYFASEIKSLLACDGIPCEIDPITMDQIFTFWSPLPGRTAFKTIHELKPGHYLTASKGKISIKRYWDIPYVPRSERLNWNPDQICEAIHHLLMDAVRIRLRADVQVGTYLSGGLDSSGITALVARNFNNAVSTFGIRFEDSDFDEGEFQNQMVSFLGVDHHELCATNQGIAEALPDVIRHMEKPVLRTAPIPLFLLSRLVRENSLKVVLTGEGADEVFGGYNIFREAKVRSFWARQPKSPRRAALMEQLYPYIFKNPRQRRMLSSFFERGLDEAHDPLFSHRIRWDNTARIKAFFSEKLKAEIGPYRAYDHIKEQLPIDFDRWDTLAKAQYLETVLFLSNYLLSSQGDRVAMAHSVEIRLPYLDYRIIEFMAKVPPRWKILGLNEKYILKKMYQGILPDSITDRPKNPYRAPIKQSLLNHKPPEYVQEMVSKKALEDAGLFDAKKVAGLMQKLQRQDNASEVDNMALVGIVSSQLLHHQFVSNSNRSSGCSFTPDLFVDHRSQTTSQIS